MTSPFTGAASKNGMSVSRSQRRLKTLNDANNQIILYFPNNIWPITTYQYIYKIRLVLKMNMKSFLTYIAPTVYNKLIPFNYTIILVVVYNAQTFGGIPFAL